MRSAVGEQLLGSLGFQRHTHVVALGAQEVLQEFCCIPVAFCEQHDDSDAVGILAGGCPASRAIGRRADGALPLESYRS